MDATLTNPMFKETINISNPFCDTTATLANATATLTSITTTLTNIASNLTSVTANVKSTFDRANVNAWFSDKCDQLDDIKNLNQQIILLSAYKNELTKTKQCLNQTKQKRDLSIQDKCADELVKVEQDDKQEQERESKFID